MNISTKTVVSFDAETERDLIEAFEQANPDWKRITEPSISMVMFVHVTTVISKEG